MIVVFDIGNVLLRWNPRNLYRKTFDDEARMERFLATALAMDFVAHTDTAPDFAAAVEARAKAFPEFAAELRLFHERWIETLGGPIDENVALLRRLKSAGRPVHALSNFATDKFALARDSNRLSERVRRRGDLRPCRRREARGAHLRDPVRARGATPEDLLFIDDSPANVRAAEALGMAAIHFRPGVDLERELAARGALP